METQQSEVDQLIKKAATAHEALAALQFSQAAINVAHARQVVQQVEKSK